MDPPLLDILSRDGGREDRSKKSRLISMLDEVYIYIQFVHFEAIQHLINFLFIFDNSYSIHLLFSSS